VEGEKDIGFKSLRSKLKKKNFYHKPASSHTLFQFSERRQIQDSPRSLTTETTRQKLKM